MRYPPPSVVASWPKPNYVDPETRGLALVIVNSVSIILVLIVVGLRCWTRLKITGSFGADDVCIVLATVHNS